MTVSYIPSKDELVLKFRPLEGKPSKEFGRFRLWWDDEGDIYGIGIMPYMEELEDFKKNLNRVQLGGFWKGVKITEGDIEKIREGLLKKLGEKW